LKPRLSAAAYYPQEAGFEESHRVEVANLWDNEAERMVDLVNNRGEEVEGPEGLATPTSELRPQLPVIGDGTWPNHVV